MLILITIITIILTRLVELIIFSVLIYNTNSINNSYKACATLYKKKRIKENEGLSEWNSKSHFLYIYLVRVI